MGEQGEHESIAIKPGWIIKDCSHANGGVHYRRKYQRDEQTGERRTVDFETRKIIDHVIVVRDLDATVKRVDYLLRKHCTRTSLGWFATDEALVKVREGLTRVEDEARALNTSAAIAGSCHRAYIGIAPLRVDTSTPEAAREIARTVRDCLTDILVTLRKGEIGQELAGKLLRARNLDQLATGMQAEALRFGLEQLGQARRDIRIALKAGTNPAEAGAAVNLEAVENAIALFDPLPVDFHTTNPVDDALRA